MKPASKLEAELRAIDGASYGAYKRILGSYQFERFTLHIDYVQGDPFAAPSRLRLALPADAIQLPQSTYDTRERRIACGDYLNRRIATALLAKSRPRGSGVSGLLSILEPGQQVIERTSLQVERGGGIVVRLAAGLPAQGRRILSDACIEMLLRDMPGSVESSLFSEALDTNALLEHVGLGDDSRALRGQLAERGLVAFIPDGARLPRLSGIDDRPLASERAVPFRSPADLRATLTAPGRGELTGVGVPAGVTLIVGGGYHGKSTLLRAIERGIYDHIGGDGRELAVTAPGAVKVRAEDGRSVSSVDISNFISNLPGGEDTTAFSTDNASGSTSQAAAISEALEAGATCLLIDEDTSATNFMIRDARMQTLIEDESEPITPFIDRARQIYDELGVSTVIVVGGAGDYFDVADTVIGMRAYTPENLTDRAKEIAVEMATERTPEGGPWAPLRRRVPVPGSIDPSAGRRSVSIKVSARDRALFGREEIDLGAVEQIAEVAQTRAIAQALAYASGRWIDGARSVREALDGLMGDVAEGGLDVMDSREMGDYAEFRIFELAAALGRLRSLRVDAGDT